MDVTEFRAGGEPQCEVFFDPRRDSPVAGRSTKFSLMDDGWYVKSTGTGEVLINQRPVSGLMRVRSGDILRMSDRGPDFSFSIVSHSAAAAATTASPWGQSARQPAPSRPAAVAAAPAERPAPQSPAATVPVPQPAESGVSVSEPAAVETLPVRGITFSRRSLWIGGGVGLLALLSGSIAWIAASRRSPPPAIPVETPKADRMERLRKIQHDREENKKKQEDGHSRAAPK